jgi:hypothetical protein
MILIPAYRAPIKNTDVTIGSGIEEITQENSNMNSKALLRAAG